VLFCRMIALLSCAGSTPARAVPCRRATSDTTAPDAYDSAAIRPLTSSLHRRRRPATTWISTRPRGFRSVNYMVNHICEPYCT
jgi:hypothetical protein